MRNKYLLLPVLFALTGISRVGLADDGSSGITVGALSAVQSETAMYKAQCERAKALREINGPGLQTGQALPYAFQATQQPAGAEEPLPVVKLVSGSSKSLRVSLLYSGGFEIDAQVGGPELPGGYKLENISMDSVIVSRNGKRYSLGFSSSTPEYRSPGVSARMPASGFQGLPGAPMGMSAPTYSPGQP